MLEGVNTMPNRLDRIAQDSSQLGDCKLYVYVKKVKQNSKTYYYLIIEEYLGKGKRRPLAQISIQKLLKDYAKKGVIGENPLWCGGWDLNPRRPTPTGLEPAPFALARAPPHETCIILLCCSRGYFL